MNMSVLGDTIISSLILEHDYVFQNNQTVYFLFPEVYKSLFENYTGKIILLPYNKHKYKWSITYRFKLLSYLNKLNIDKCFNLTSSRGLSNDELALLTGARETYCFHNSWIRTPKAFSRLVDKKYSHIICKDILNEYQRHAEVLQQFGILKYGLLPNQSIFLGSLTGINISDFINKLRGSILIAPLAGDKDRTWGRDNFLNLARKLSSQRQIIILGSKEEKDELTNSFPIFTNIAGQLSLQELAILMEECDLFIGNDSGLTHLALRVNIPIIAIIGGGTFGKYLPFDKHELNNFFYKELPCFGCEWFCEFKQKFCITEVDVHSVYRSAIKILNKF